MKRRVPFLLALVLLVVAAVPVYSQEEAKQKAVDLVTRGIEHIEAVGQEPAFEDFTDRTGEFVDGEFYIFVVDFDGVTLAHGGNAQLVGMNMGELKDADGVYFIQEFIKAAQEKSQGWVDYKWSNPETQQVKPKSSYVERPEGKNYFLGCGIYLN